MRRRVLGLCLFLSLASGCSLNPPLPRPQADLPASYGQQTGEGGSVQGLGWQQLFADARLRRLIDLAMENNRDMRLAVLNVEAAQAHYGVTRAARLPALELDGAASRERAGREADTGEDGAAVAQRSKLQMGITAFELDLFGRARSLSQAAMARYLASEEGRTAAQLSLVSTVADTYFAQLNAQSQLLLAEHTLKDWSHSLTLAEMLLKASQNSRLDVAQAESQVAVAQAELEARRREAAAASHALMQLVGTALPDDLPEALPMEAQLLAAHLPPGLPSELLLRRPDLRQAEQALRAANADIGAARAAFFPRLSLTATLGYASPALSRLFDSESRSWSFAPQISQPLFQGGRLQAELDLSRIRQSEAVARYEAAIQQAFREVADALAGVETYDPQIVAQLRAVAAEQQRVNLSALRYRAGLDGRLELLDAQRQLYAAQRTLLDLQRARIGNVVALYKALGGEQSSLRPEGG